MSAPERIMLHLTPAHVRKLQKGGNIQLSHEKLIMALSHEPTVELHMAKKHVSDLLRAHRNGKGYRLMHEKIVGGKIHLKDIGRKIVNTAKKVMKNPIVKKVAKELGHIAIGVANNYAQQNGMDASPYAYLAHNAVEGRNIQHELEEQVANDVINYAHQQTGFGVRRLKSGGKVKVPKELKQLGNTLKKAFTNNTAKTIYKGIANAGVSALGDVVTGNPIAGAVLGGSPYMNRQIDKIGSGVKKEKTPRRFVKGSVEAKEHMAKLCAMRKGGALIPAGM